MIYGCDSACNGTDPATGAWVAGFDASSGAEKFRVPLANWGGTMQAGPGADFCQVATGPWSYHSFPNSDITIAGDGFAYLSYFTIESNGTTRKSVAERWPDDAYDDWDRLVADTVNSNFSAATSDLEALWQATGQQYPGSSLMTALQAGDRTTAITIENGVSKEFKRLCDRTESLLFKLHLLRVGSDGVVSVKWWKSLRVIIRQS